MSKENPKPIISWVSLNKALSFQKLLNLIQAGMNGLLLFILICFIFQPPLVVQSTDGYNEFFYPQRKNVTIKENDLEKIALKFIQARYSWDVFNISSILKGLTPFVTDNLKDKIEKDLLKLEKQLPKDKKISQSIANVQTDVSMDKIIVSFDQIIKVDEIPLLTHVDIEFLMIKDSPNSINPLGIFVNNLTQYEEI